MIPITRENTLQIVQFTNKLKVDSPFEICFLFFGIYPVGLKL